jgi:hypothetical protein
MITVPFFYQRAGRTVLEFVDQGNDVIPDPPARLRKALKCSITSMSVTCWSRFIRHFPSDDRFELRRPCLLTCSCVEESTLPPPLLRLFVCCGSMRATRHMLNRASGSGVLPGGPRTLLPPPTTFGVLSSACQGAWSLVVDEESRKAYEGLVTSSVIRDAVLSRASTGAILTYALFHELQNPLFAKHRLNLEEFVSAAGPALENFHDALGKLRNELPESLQGDKKDLDEKLKLSDDEILKSSNGLNLTEVLLGVNLWRRQAEQDPNSLAGILSRMTTDACFDALFYTSKLDVLKRSHGPVVYQDSVVNDVALLSARAAVMRDPESEINEFQATDELTKDYPVGAQMDVLFEVTHTFKTIPPLLTPEKADSDSTTATTSSSELSASADPTDASSATKDGTPPLEVTNLAVAIFEGWLHKGPTKRLHWKLALIREAFEFPLATPVMRQS